MLKMVNRPSIKQEMIIKKLVKKYNIRRFPIFEEITDNKDLNVSINKARKMLNYNMFFPLF